MRGGGRVLSGGFNDGLNGWLGLSVVLPETRKLDELERELNVEDSFLAPVDCADECLTTRTLDLICMAL